MLSDEIVPCFLNKYAGHGTQQMRTLACEISYCIFYNVPDMELITKTSADINL